MGSIFGKLGFSGINPPKGEVGPGEMPFDRCRANIGNLYEDEVRYQLREQAIGSVIVTPNKHTY